MPNEKEQTSFIYWRNELERMSQIELAEMQRFSPAGHIVFTDTALYEIFKTRFALLGGMTPEISKRIGWER